MSNVAKIRAPSQQDSATPTYYVSDHSKLTIVELWRLGKGKRAFIGKSMILLAKLLRTPVRSGVPRLYDNAKFVEFDEIPDEIRRDMEALNRSLQSAGFVARLAQKMTLSKGNFGYAVYLRSADGLSNAAVMTVRASAGHLSHSETAVTVSTRRQNGSAIGTTNTQPRLKDPPELKMEYLSGATPEKVVARHRRRLLDCVDAIPLRDEDYADKILSWTRRYKEFQIERGILVPATPEEMVRYQDQITPIGVV